jgi:DNA-binding NtrC family response regulator
VDFFPLRLAEGPFFLGRAIPVALAEPAAPPLPEKLVALRALATRRFGLDLLAGDLPAVRRLREQVRLARQVRAPVLLVGDEGTGKLTLARTIHYGGPERERSFVNLDCRRLPAPAVAHLLFGDRGASQRSVAGAVYLREPQCLPRDLQLSLLTALDEGEGGSLPRLFAGMRSPPAEEVRASRLLEGLACALGPLVLALPTLRERLADLPRTVERLLERASVEDRGEPGPQVVGLTPAAWDVVRSHSWPGNYRELYTVLADARGRCQGDHIDAGDLPAALRLALRVQEAPGGPAERPLPLPDLLEQVERRLIELALRRARGNKTRAAELLSIWRPRLMRRMAALKMEGAEGPADDEGK